MAARNEKEKGVNVQVLLRCRPFNDEELRTNAPQVISCNESRREVTVNLNVASKQVDRTFTFDKVFGPQAQQKDIYEQAIVPIVNEVLEGFNCTIFAYGQTGTGKTYTMEGGGRKAKNGELPTEAGVIPRAVQQIFDILEGQNAEYSMKVTFIELYNEEITDLLALDDLSRSLDDKQRKPLALMEDGKGGVLVRGLEEEIVYSAGEIYTLLERGSAKRRTAETLLNKQSSRSHSIFSITIHIKEATPEGEELIKCGKLNLVDLAGSENISRSGAKESRAREAGEINKSLLTLGRVITALVEHLGHIPYRDSKLTRLLRDSLGGRTKTCVIATVSPSVHCLEETLSTLDYAHRAKNIKNKPEVNQKMMKSTLIKDLYVEIEKLKAEVTACREKNGIFLPRERYYQEEAEKKAMSERIEQMECDLELKNKQLDDIQELLDSQRHVNADLNIKLEMLQSKLEQTQVALGEAKERLKRDQLTIKEREYVITALQQSEVKLVEQASSLQSELEMAVNDILGLHQKINRKDMIEAGNRKIILSFHSDIAQQLENLHKNVTKSVESQQQQLQTMEEYLKSFLTNKEEVIEGLKLKMLSLKDSYHFGLKSLNNVVQVHEQTSSSTFEKLNSSISNHALAVEEFLSTAVSEAELVLKDLQTTLHMQQSEISSFSQQQQEIAHCSIEATRAISKETNEVFETLQRSADELCASVNQNQQTQEQCFSGFEKTYEEFCRQEEEKLLANISQLLAASTAHKTQLICSKVHNLRGNATKNAENLQERVLEVQILASGAQKEWQTFMKHAENGHKKGSAALQASHCQMEELLHRSVKNTTAAEVNWRDMQMSLQDSEKQNLLTVNSIVKEGIYGNERLFSEFEQLKSSIQSDVQDSNQSILGNIETSLHLDQDAVAAIVSRTATQSLALNDLEASHDSSIKEIKNEANSCFTEGYQEDRPTSMTPGKRSINVPSKASIENLRAPSAEKLAEEFQEANNSPVIVEKSPSYKNLTVRETKIPIFADSTLLKDNRPPLAPMN